MKSRAGDSEGKTRVWVRGALLAIGAVVAVLLVPLLPVALFMAVLIFPSGSYPSWTFPLLILITPGLLTALWMASAAMWRGERRRAAAWSAPLLIVLVLAFPIERAVYYSYAAERYERFAGKLFPAPVNLEAPIYAYSRDGGFTGDGHSYAVFALPAELERAFRTPERGELAPTLHAPEDWGEDWGAVTWTSTPMPEQYQKPLDFALTKYRSMDDPRLDELFDEIRALMSRPGSYLGFIDCCARHGPYNWPSDVSWFVIDLEGRRLIFASNNI